MASGFCKICYEINNAKIETIFNELVSFYEQNDVLLTDERGNIEFIMDEGGIKNCSYNDLATKITDNGSVAFFFKVSERSRLYCRFRQLNQKVIIEEYDFSWMPESKERIFTSRLFVNRMINLISLDKVHFFWGVIDKTGRTEDIDWADFFEEGNINTEIIEMPTVLCTSSKIANIKDAQNVEVIGDYKVVYFESIL